jgi:hypothetical protein
LETVPIRRVNSSERTNQGGHAVTEKSDDAAVAKANLVEHLKNIAIACDDARLSENSSYRGGSEGTELLVSALPYRKRAAVRTGPKTGKALGAEDE